MPTGSGVRSFGTARAASAYPCMNAPEPASPTDLSPRTWKEIAIDTWKEAGNDNISIIAAGVSFYAFLAFVPLLTAFVLSYGLVAEPASVVAHMQTLTNIMPQNAAEIVGEQLRSMVAGAGTETGLALIVAIGIALYGASKGAGSIIIALNVAYDVKERRSFIGRTAMALTMTAGAVLVLFLAILAVGALNLVERLVPDWGGLVHVALQAGFFLLAAAAVVLLLAVVYRYGPNRPDAEWRWITPGSLLATIVWLAATLGFGFYVSNFGNYNATYGSLGAVIVFLTWLYLTAYIVLMGAELNAQIENRVGTATVAEEPVAPAPPAAAPVPDGEPPSAARVAARLGLFGMMLALLGGRSGGASREKTPPSRHLDSRAKLHGG